MMEFKRLLMKQLFMHRFILFVCLLKLIDGLKCEGKNSISRDDVYCHGHGKLFQCFHSFWT